MKGIAYALIAAAALCTGAVGAIFIWPSTSPAALEQSDSELAFRPHPGAQLPLRTELQDESGRAVTLENYFSKTPVILVLEYLRCTSLCGVTLRNVVETLDDLPLAPGRDYQLVAISIDPRDKPADAASAKAKYAAFLRQRGATGGLHFLTGSPAAVQQIADTVGFPYRYDKLLDAYIHPAGFVIASPDGAISRYIEGLAVTSNELLNAFADAQQNKAQGPLARILLFCHVQGAPLGRFTVPVLGAFMAADLAAGLAAFTIFIRVRRRPG